MREGCSRLEGGVVVRTARGTQFEAKLVHAGRKSLVFEAYGPEPAVQVGEQLSDVTLTRGGSTVNAGPARVEALLSTGPSLIVTAAPHGAWVPDTPVNGAAPGDLTTRGSGPTADQTTPLLSLCDDANALIRQWREGQRLLPAYQIAVDNIRSFLARLSEWLAVIDPVLEATDPRFRAERSAQIAESVFAIVRPQ